MTKVGVCRVSSIFIIIIFTLSVLGYSQYYFCVKQPVDYVGYMSYVMLYIFPVLLLLTYALLLSTYLLCIIVKPRKIPDQYNLTASEIANFMIHPDNQRDFQTLAILTRDYIKVRSDLQVRERDYRHGGLRICEICSIIKPDRSHHCSICKRCVMRMDHHCLWVNNCIHEDNHKYFMQTITLGIIISMLTVLHYAVNVLSGCKEFKLGAPCYNVCILLYISLSLSALILMFLLFLTLDHCSNLFRGQTSYERVYDRDHYSRGWRNNFMEIMGQNIFQWVCPFPSSRLSEEHEPLICTVAEQSSQAWLTTSNHETRNGLVPTPEEDEPELSSNIVNSSLSTKPDSGLSCPPRQNSGPSRQNSGPSRQNSGPSRPNSACSSTRERSETIEIYDDNNEETLSLAYQPELGVERGGIITRVRTPSVYPEDK